MGEPVAISSTAAGNRRLLLLGLLVLAHAIFCLSFQPFHGDEKWRTLLMGAVFLQPVLFTIWTVLGPPPIAKRLPLTLAAYAAVILSGGISDREWLAPDYLVIAGAFVGATTVLTLISAAVFRWRISNVREIAAAGAVVNQFSLKFLIAFTTLCALLLGLGRALSLNTESRQHFSWSNDVLEMLVPMGAMLLITLPSVFIPLLILSRRPHTSVLIVLPLVWAGLSWLAVETIIGFAPGSVSRGEITGDIALIQLGAAAAGISSAIVVRVAGYRLVKRPALGL